MAAEITNEDRQVASRLLDDLTFGGHSQDGAVSVLAQALADQRRQLLGTARIEHAVRNRDTGWVYALPKLLPKFLDGKRGEREAAEWHQRQLNAGNEPEDYGWSEIVRRVVTAWEVVEGG